MQLKTAILILAGLTTASPTALIARRECTGAQLTDALDELTALARETAMVTRNFNSEDPEALLEQYEKRPHQNPSCDAHGLNTEEQTEVCQSYVQFAAAEGEAVQAAVDNWSALQQGGVEAKIKGFFLENYQITVDTFTPKIIKAVPDCAANVVASKEELDNKFQELETKQ